MRRLSSMGLTAASGAMSGLGGRHGGPLPQTSGSAMYVSSALGEGGFDGRRGVMDGVLDGAMLPRGTSGGMPTGAGMFGGEDAGGMAWRQREEAAGNLLPNGAPPLTESLGLKPMMWNGGKGGGSQALLASTAMPTHSGGPRGGAH